MSKRSRSTSHGRTDGRPLPVMRRLEGPASLPPETQSLSLTMRPRTEPGDPHTGAAYRATGLDTSDTWMPDRGRREMNSGFGRVRKRRHRESGPGSWHSDGANW